MDERAMSRHKQDQRPLNAQTSHSLSAEKTRPSGMSLSMHDGVEVWCDCCSCEAEPYWLEAFAQPGREDPEAR
jgi:hypothetical protein